MMPRGTTADVTIEVMLPVTIRATVWLDNEGLAHIDRVNLTNINPYGNRQVEEAMDDDARDRLDQEARSALGWEPAPEDD